MHGRADVRAFYTNHLWRAFPDLTLELTEGPYFHPQRVGSASGGSARAPTPGRSIHRAWCPRTNSLRSGPGRSLTSATNW
jgi:hypothetical protein